ncbi:MAG: hypothetical protein DI590_02260 [Methylorubrum populi]|nr:MAG: hypothetical protein DI590_02260 [Methylorubrum populi]
MGIRARRDRGARSRRCVRRSALNLMSDREELERVVFAAARELFARDGARRHPRVVELARLDYSLAHDRR